MSAIYGIILAAALAMTALAVGSWFDQQERARLEGPSARQQALTCWHEFATGRRATPADCPEL
jgi:hypothetical protein